MKYKPEITDESPPALEVGAGVAVRGAGRSTTRMLRDPLDTYGEEPGEGVRVYAFGLCFASACVPKGMDRSTVEAVVNALYPHPKESELRWAIADEPFASGDPNPCPCNDSADRLHYLLAC